MKQVSEKRKTLNTTYKWLREVWLTGRRCWIRLDGCQGFATDIHHVISRSQDSTRILDVWNWCAACRHCHARTELNPNESRRQCWNLPNGSHERTHHETMTTIDTCRRCGAPIVWARWAGNNDSVPLDADLVELLDTDDGTIQAQYREYFVDGTEFDVVDLVDADTYDPELPLLRPHRLSCTPDT